MLLPNPTTNETATGLFPAPPEGPAGMPPDRLRITRLALDVQVTPVGMVAGPWAGPGEFVSAAMPSGKMVGWLNTSAPFAQPGNTVLTGRHQAQGLTVFHGLWTLEPGDEIVLYAGNQSRRYIVDEVLILPEQDQPIEVRLANAEYIQPTEDERLTSLRAGRKRVTPTVQWSSHYRSNSDEHLSAIATSSVGPHHRARSRIGYWSGAAIRGADVRSGRTLFSCSGYTHSR